MGVFNGRDVYSPHLITAEITDASNNKYFIPIKNMIGDYFIVENINNLTYVFKLDGARIKTTKQRAARPFQTVDYDISHYLPVSNDNKLIELVERINNLPRINNKLLSILKVLGRTEKEGDKFKPHDLTAMTKELSEHKDKYKEQIAEMIKYFKQLEVDQIVTPLRRLTDFIEDDLKTTDPRYGGAIFDAAVQADIENRKITNSPKTAKKSLALLIAIPIILILIGVVLYQAYELGVFDNLGASLSPSFGGKTDDQIMKQYPNCPALRAAVDSGKVNYDSLSKAVQDVYNSCPAPTGAAP